MVDEIWLYALADAARMHDVALHGSTRMPNHHHTDVTPRQDNLPTFAQQLQRDVSCAIKTLLAHERYDVPQDIWDGRAPHYMRLLDPAAQASQLIYDHLNAPAAGLVARPEHMPGQQVDWSLWKSEGIVIRRPPLYFAADRPSELLLSTEAPPLLMRAFGGDLDALIYHLRQLARDGLREIHRAQKKRPPLGAQKLRRVHPYDEPRSLAEPRGDRVPTFRMGARGIIGKATHVRACAEVRKFREAYHACFSQRLDGDDVAFPHGTYAMRVIHRAKVAEPDPEALVTHPGPLLHEVLEELEHSAPPSTEARNEMLQEVRSAWADQVEDIVAHEELNYRKPSPDDAAELDEDERPPMQVVHRSEPRRNWRKRPRRTVTLRDSRRGRPPKKRGADPPGEE